MFHWQYQTLPTFNLDYLGFHIIPDLTSKCFTETSYIFLQKLIQSFKVNNKNLPERVTNGLCSSTTRLENLAAAK